MNGNSIYALSSISSMVYINSSEYDDYVFYSHLPAFCDEQVEGCINWDDDYTVLSETLSSLSTWYNDGELLEEMFNYILHKGLNLEK